MIGKSCDSYCFENKHDGFTNILNYGNGILYMFTSNISFSGKKKVVNL